MALGIARPRRAFILCDQMEVSLGTTHDLSARTWKYRAAMDLVRAVPARVYRRGGPHRAVRVRRAAPASGRLNAVSVFRLRGQHNTPWLALGDHPARAPGVSRHAGAGCHLCPLGPIAGGASYERDNVSNHFMRRVGGRQGPLPGDAFVVGERVRIVRAPASYGYNDRVGIVVAVSGTEISVEVDEHPAETRCTTFYAEELEREAGLYNRRASSFDARLAIDQPEEGCQDVMRRVVNARHDREQPGDA